MKNIKLLDCTLRDGGRVIDCQFSYLQTESIVNSLIRSGVEFIELGFLDETKSDNASFSTYFDDIFKVQPFLKNGVNYSLFINFGRFDFFKLPAWKETLPKFIRVGFTIEDFIQSIEELKKSIEFVKNQGYEVFLQPLNTPAYDKESYLKLLDFANELAPYSFAIVDTFGSMFQEKLEKYFLLANENLSPLINIDFHSHNNLQLSFSNAIWLTKQDLGQRELILDATLLGLGRGGGNLNLELVGQYTNGYCGKNYNIVELVKLIDKEILPIKKQSDWGYSLPAFLGGVYNLHPNKTQKFYEEFIDGKS